MSNRDLKREPYQVNDDIWYYEEPKGLEFHISYRDEKGSHKIKQTVFIVPWQRIRAALRHKDK